MTSDQIPLLKRCLENLDFDCEEKTDNSVLVAKSQGVRITVYKTNKVLFQGSETDKWVGRLVDQGFIEKTPLVKGEKKEKKDKTTRVEKKKAAAKKK